MNTGPQAVFRALSDQTRRQILLHLAEEDLTIADIAGRFDISRTAINKHLKILEEGGLITARVRGRERRNVINTEPLKSAFEWLSYFDRFWDSKLSKLQREISKDLSGKEETGT